MFNVEDKQRYLEEYAERINNKLETALLGVDLSAYMADSNVAYCRNFMKKVKGCFDSMMPEGIPMPKVSMYVTPLSVAGEITSVSVSITNKVSSDRKFKFTEKIPQQNANGLTVKFFKYVYNELLVDYLIESNLGEVNRVLNDIAKGIDLPYDITIVSPIGADGKVVSAISDEEVCFVADPERVFDMGKMLILQEVSETITEDIIQKGIKQVSDELVTTQTPEQLVGIHGGIFIRYLCNISKHVKPMTMIKGVCNRNVLNYHGSKQVITYYKDEEIFSLLVKTAKGYEVVLSPFNMKTLRKADIDVVAKVNSLIGKDAEETAEPTQDLEEAQVAEE